MGAPVALASDPLKRSSLFLLVLLGQCARLQIPNLCIKHLLRDDGIGLIHATISHSSHTQDGSCPQFPTIIGKEGCFWVFTFYHRSPAKILCFIQITNNVTRRCSTAPPG